MSQRALAIAQSLGIEQTYTNIWRSDLARLLLDLDQPAEAYTVSSTGLAYLNKRFGTDHFWTKRSARVTADALDTLGRTDEASAMREKYAITPEKPSAG